MEHFLKKYSNISIIVLGFLFFIAVFQSQNFQLDASSDTLILENDEDLKNYRKIINDYSTKDFLLITITSPNKILSKENLDLIKNLTNDVSKLIFVDSIQSILDAPILKSDNQSLTDLVDTQITLESKNLNLLTVEKEFTESPIFSELIISKDGTTSGIIINLKENRDFVDISKNRNDLKSLNNLTKSQKKKLSLIEKEYERLKKEIDLDRSSNIKEIRDLILNYNSQDFKLRLGGVSMIADDTISYVKNDIIIFGFGILLFIVLILYLVFRNFLWIFICLSNCLYALIIMLGTVSFLNWKVTVISSNFISLMLILTLSMTIHIIVRYRKVLVSNPLKARHFTVAQNMMEMIRPCIFTTLTTIFAFGTLYLSNIKPIMDFGLMMCTGLIVTLVSSFTFLPVMMMKFNLKVQSNESQGSYNTFFIRLINNYSNLIIIGFIILFSLGVYGIQKLKVENSFVNYFKSNTEIYKGMKLIDDKLGGTTPLDIIIQFNEEEYFDDLDEDFLDLDFDYNLEDYWFTKEKMDLIKNVHDYIDSFEYTGKVLSLASIIRVAEELNSDEEFDNLELSVIYKKLPLDLKSQIIDPYLSIENNQARITVRMIDTNANLERNKFISEINNKFNNDFSSENYKIFTTGILILYNNMLQSLFDSQIISLGTVMLGIFLMLAFLFQSWRLAFIGILPNIIACITILGIMGLASIPLDLMTITIAAITIGIAVDNCIHYVYRFKESYLITNDYNKTVLVCNQSVGKAIRSTSMTIIVGFSILIFSNFWPTIYFGIFTALAMLIALVGSLTLLPILIVKTRVLK
ncbi:MAG: RND family transporter [Candidatus Pelagibacterales bacterium]|tara:strand:+ start:9 stop:2426 length:2418 start_codon:yes stop_codon:yes gene_type:complete